MTSSNCLYHDEKGRLVKAKGPILEHGTVGFHLTSSVSWKGLLLDLLSASFTFQGLGYTESETILGLYRWAPRLQRLSIHFQRYIARTMNDALNEIVQPLPTTAVRHFSLYANGQFRLSYYFRSFAARYFSKLETLRTDLNYIELSELPNLCLLAWTHEHFLEDIMIKYPAQLAQL